MKVTPTKWTHHHTHRIFHVVMLVNFTFIIGAAFLLFLIFAWKAQGETVQLTADVSGVTEGPTAVLGSGPITPPQIPKPINYPEVKVTPQNSDLIKNSQGVEVVRFQTPQPMFSGFTNIRDAEVKLAINAQIPIRASVTADEDGNWFWKSSESLTNGLYTIKVTATDPNDIRISASTQIDFYIDVATNSQIKNDIPSAGSKTGNLFDVLAAIPIQFRQVQPGGEVLVRIRLINFGSVGNPVDVNVEYTITDEYDKIIMHSSETLAVATQISFIKTFFTAPNLPPGNYKLTVRVPSKDLIATATAMFQVSGKKVLAWGGGTVNYTAVFQVLLGLIFFFSIIGYFEYNKVSLLSSVIRQVDEQDLIPEIKIIK